MSWQPSNEPDRYDRARVAQLSPIKTEIKKLNLPLIRVRKLNGICSAIEMQIENGGDSPEVNKLLLDALRAGILHQVNRRQARHALRAIDAIEQAEAKRWEHVKAGTLPPVELDPDEKLDGLMQEGYDLIYDQQQIATGCDRWLEAWEFIKRLATPDMRSIEDFDRAYPLTQSLFNWAGDMEMELHNAEPDAPHYKEQRIRFVHEFLAQFPDVDDNRYLNLRRAEGEALWELDRQAEAEAVYRALVEKQPDEAWTYIGWSDQYYLMVSSAKEYEKGEALLLQALARPTLNHRDDVLDRLVGLYEEWGQPEKQAPHLAELEEIQGQKVTPRKLKPPPGKLSRFFGGGVKPKWPKPAKPKSLRRNDPCWCGSGKKYKQCHLKSDRS